MNFPNMNIIKIYLLVVVIIFINECASQFEICDNYEPDVYIRSPTGCAYYIYCDGVDSFEDMCPDDMFFDPELGYCDDPENVDCADTPATDEEETTTDEEETTTDEEETTTVTQALPTTTKSTIQITTPTPTPKWTSQASSLSTKEKITTITTPEPTTATKPSDYMTRKCPSVDDPKVIIFLPSVNNCAEYFLCYHGTTIPMYCAQNLHFNPITEKCDFPNEVDCEIKNNNNLPFPRCHSTTIEFFPHPENCEYFLYCIFGHMTVQQCPFYYYWDIDTNSCQLRTIAKCLLNVNKSTPTHLRIFF